jgi:DNA replication and repair protein RecF
MFLRSLSVVNFKNIREAKVEFSPRLNTFIGDNGAGKTNLLDALYSLSFSKSYFNASDQLNLMHNETFFMLQGKYERKGDEETVTYGYQNGQKKQIKRNGKLYNRMSEHIGLLPLVMVSPADASLILGGSDERRKFMDGVISQYNAAYLEDLLRYNRILLQRNNLLKQYAFDGGFRDMLEIYDGELVEAGQRIHIQRTNFIERLIPVFQKYYDSISGGIEEVGLHYVSDLDDKPFELLLSQSVANDKAAQYTTSGIHKDDLVLNLGGYPLKKQGSQGQQKSFLIALKLAQFEFICTVSGINPILLLDDIFDKLDKKRVEQIVTIVSGEKFGQIFITDTNRDHLDAILHTITPEYRIYLVENGSLNTIR